MPNRLSHENSPYLLQHQNNPVDWYPWGKEALQRAKQENKPIFLSIGYAACHWCHVMEHESFEDESTAKLMNEHFINIKVDREERPDLDGIYMSAVVSLTGQGGWPMSLFLTPDGQPFYGGTYFPPTARYGMPAFPELLQRIADTWQEDSAAVMKSSDNITAHLKKTVTTNPQAQSLSDETITRAISKLEETYDWENGGWGQAPKFPQPMAIRFLLMEAAKGDQQALKVATHALKAMAKGGMYDLLGGGFARYSVDNEWLVPHFEKMLYDNAQLARVYLHAYLLTGDDEFKQICQATLNFIIRELTDDEGGFFSSLDADSEGAEGIFYIWDLDEISSHITHTQHRDIFIKAYGITSQGNFEGKNILQRKQSDKALSKQFKIPAAEIKSILSKTHETLYAVRSKRIWPGLDDKILVSWNALALITFAEAARYLQDATYLQVAVKNANFLLNNLNKDGRLLRSWRKGQAKYDAYLEDLASLILGLLSLYQSDPDERWYQAAGSLSKEMIANFTDPDGGFFDTRDDHETLIIRPKELQDNALPCGNALASMALFQLSAFEGDFDLFELAKLTASPQQEFAVQYPTAQSQWLCAIDFGISPAREIAVITNHDNQAANALVDVIWENYRPFSVVAIASAQSNDTGPALLRDRPIIDDHSTAYVCSNFTCKQPVTTPNQLREQLTQAQISKLSETGQ